MFKWYMKTTRRNQPLLGAFREVLDQVEVDLCVVVPYIGLGTVKDMIESLRRRVVKGSLPVQVRLVTAGDAYSYLLGDGELEAVRYLTSPAPQMVNVNVQVRTTTKLHAKVYLAPGKRALVGSANLTANGMKRNKEAGLAVSDPGMLELIQTDFEDMWNAASPVNLGQVEEAIATLQKLREETPTVREVWEKRKDQPIFPPAKETTPAKQGEEVRDRSEGSTSKWPEETESTKERTERPKEKATPMGNSPLPLDVQKTGRTEILIDQRSRRPLSIHLLTLSRGRWRIEFRRSGRPPGLAWESLVDSRGELAFTVVGDRLVIGGFGRMIEVDLNTLDEVMPSVGVVNWSAIVSWKNGEVYVDGRDIYVFREHESTNVEL